MGRSALQDVQRYVAAHPAEDHRVELLAGRMGLSARHFARLFRKGVGLTVEGSTFPNWVGDVRTRRELTVVASGDRMTENFQRPDGTKIVLQWQRVR